MPRRRDSNPEFASLPGLMDWDRADVAWGRDSLGKALRLLDGAIARAPNYWLIEWLIEKRGVILEREDSSRRALDDLRHAIALRPARVEPHFWISYSEWEMAAAPGHRDWVNLLRGAVTDIHRAAALDSTFRDTPIVLHQIDSAAATSGIR